MNVKILFPHQFSAFLLVLLSITIFSCSNNSNYSDSEKNEAVVEEISQETEQEVYAPPVPKVTFQGIAIEGTEGEFMDSLKSCGFVTKKSKSNLFRITDYECAVIYENAPELYKRLRFYSCEPKNQAKDAEPQYTQVYVTFLDGELWKIQVGLTYHHSEPPIANLASEFGDKYSTSMTKRELPMEFIRMYGGDYIYEATIGNTKVAISKYQWFAGFENAAFEYTNMSIDSKINALKVAEKEGKAKSTIEML